MKHVPVFLITLVLAAETVAAEYVYVSIAGENRISVFDVNRSDGSLRHRANVPLKDSPGSLAVDPGRRFLFASIRPSGNLASFRIDPASGKLVPISVVSAGADPAYVTTDRTGRFLLAAYYQAGKVTVHRIGPDGSLADTPDQTVETADKAHAIVTDPSNRFALVPHTGPNAIFQFTFDAANGVLRPNDPPVVKTGEATGPRHIAFHPTHNFAYVDNEQGSSVTAFRFDRSRGRLSAIQTVSTLPKQFTGNNSCAHLEMAPSGRFVYAANRGHDSIACFAIDSVTGKLTPVQTTRTEPTPRSFNIDPSGRFLYAAGQSSGKLASYRVDDQSGRLEPIRVVPVGQQAWWVLVVDVGG